MTNPVPPSLDRFGEQLHRAAHRELSGPSGPGALLTRPTRPRILAGSTLGLAGVGAGLVLALSGGAAAPAFAVTRQDDGSVLVSVDSESSVPQANARLAAMNVKEIFETHIVSGAATTKGPVTCEPGAGVTGPAVQVMLGDDGTDVVAAGNTGAGTYHLATCFTAVPSDHPAWPASADSVPGFTATPLPASDVAGSGTSTTPSRVTGTQQTRTTLLHAVPIVPGGGAGDTGNSGNTGG